MVYYNPYTTGYYNPLYNLNNQVFFIAHMTMEKQPFYLLYPHDGENHAIRQVFYLLYCTIRIN